MMLWRRPFLKMSEFPSPFTFYYSEYSKEDVPFELLEEENRM